MVRRLVLSYLIVTLFVLIVLEVPLAIFFQQREVENVSGLLERDATALGSFYEDDLEGSQVIDPGRALQYAADSGTRVLIVDAAGISVADTDPNYSTGRDYSTRPEIATALEGGRPSGTRDSTTLQTSIIYSAVPVASGGTVHGAVRITLDSDDAGTRVRNFWIGLVAIAVVVLAASALVGWAVARSVARPIRQLEANARRFASGDLSPAPLPDEAPPEVVNLHTAMAEMAQQLTEIMDRQRGFVGDASHQLRTPLTGLRLRLEGIADGAGDPVVEAEAALVETNRLADLVNDLLHLARTDEPQQLVAIDLGQLVAERVDTWTAVAEQNEVSIVATGLRSVSVLAPDGGLEQVLDNLIDNAVDFSSSGDLVKVDLRQIGNEVVLKVVDHGHGLSDKGKRDALQRFWRGDTSRAGSGLGLSIAETLVNASSGSLTLHDTPGGGLTVIVRLIAYPEAGRGRK